MHKYYYSYMHQGDMHITVLLHKPTSQPSAMLLLQSPNPGVQAQVYPGCTPGVMAQIVFRLLPHGFVEQSSMAGGGMLAAGNEPGVNQFNDR